MPSQRKAGEEAIYIYTLESNTAPNEQEIVISTIHC